MNREEAINVVKCNWPEGRHQLSEALKTLIPEFRESEDERIRYRIINYLKVELEEHPEREKRIGEMLAYLEKQKEYIEDIRQYAYNKGLVDAEEKQKPAIIQWTGNNLKDVIDFTGKSPKFGEWFKSWEEFEQYVHSHGDILKLFCEDGSHYEVPVGAWIVKTPDGYNVPSVARFVSSSTERQRRNANGCLSWKKFEDDDSGVPALLVSKALIRRDGKYSIGFDVLGGDEYILISDIEAAIEQRPAEWSEEDKDYFDAIIAKLEVTQDDALLTDNQMDFLKSLSKRFNLQPKSIISDTDKLNLKDAPAIIRKSNHPFKENIALIIEKYL